MQALALDPGDLSWDEFALRFAAFQPGVSAAVVGTRSLKRLRRNAEIVASGPLPAEAVAQIRAAYQAIGATWEGQI
jgi:aryl-alcohol dehydrogenase-like predicted oxidoreductase